MSNFDDIIGDGPKSGDIINDELKNVRPVNHIVFLIDESGSMIGREDEVRKTFKTHLDESISVKDQDNYFSLYTFNTYVKTVFKEKLVDEKTVFPEIDNYNPGGLTALYDALGESINHIENIKEMNMEGKNHSALFIIITDGLENASKEFTEKIINKKIEELEKRPNYTFTFIGRNFDVKANYDDKFMVNLGNTVSAHSLNKQTRRNVGASMSRYYANRSRGMTKTYSYHVSSEEDKNDNKT